LIKIQHIKKIAENSDLFLKYFFFAGWAQPNPCDWAGPSQPSPTHVTGLDLASPAWSLAHASDQPLLSAYARVHEQCEGN